MKTSWIISVEQLLEWKELLSDNEVKTVSEQIDDILKQLVDQ